jgi:hypothetical protein
MHLSKNLRRFLTLAAVTLSALPSIAQPLNGTYTVGGTSPNYATLSDAVTDLNTKGVAGPVTLNIRNGNYTATTWRATINNITGASAANRITIKSETNNPANVTINVSATATTANFILKLNSASFITVKDLTLVNNGATYGRVLELAGAPANDSIINCNLNSIARTASSINTAIVYGDPLTGANNVFMNNKILNGSYGIYYSGTGTSNLVDAGVFINNTIQDAYGYGAYFYYTNNLVFNNNTITSNSANATTYGIRTYYCDGATRIVNNKISGFNGYGMYLYYCDATSTDRGLIANNVIIMKNGTGTNHGIRNYYSSYQTFCNNTVNVTGTSATAAYAGYFYYSSAAYSNNEIYNNVFSNTGGGYALFVYNPIAYDNHWDYNNIYTTGTNLIDRGTPATDYLDLQTWRTATGQDMNSLVYNPAFSNPATNLAPDAANAASWSLNGRGMHIAGNDKDINGNPRPVTTAAGVPDIGAYEFTPSVVPPNATATPVAPAAGTTQLFTFGQDTVGKITWDATAPVPASITVKQYTGTLPTGISSISSTSMYFYTDISAAAGAHVFNADIYYKDPWLGTIQGETGLRLAKKLGANPWVSYLPPISSANIDRNIITTTGLSSYGNFTGIDIANNASISEITEPTGFFCSGNKDVKVRVKNAGSNAINNVTIQWQLNGVLQTPIAYNTVIPVQGDAIITLANLNFNGVPKNIKVWTTLPNNQPDLVNADDTVSQKINSGLSGAYTVGGTTPDFADFVEAVNSLKSFGVCGPVVFNIRNGVYSGQVALDGPVSGMSTANRVTFQSESHNAANVTVSYNLATAANDNYVFRINDISNISLKDLTFSTTSTTFSHAIEIAGNSSSDSLINCVLTAGAVTTASTNTVVLYASGLTGKDNVFVGNKFINGSYGIYYRGVGTASLTSGAVFYNNTLQDQFTYGAHFYYTQDLKFRNNTITTNSTDNAYYGLYSYYCDDAYEVSGNTIKGALGGYGMYIYYSDGTATKRGRIANNVVTIGSGTNTTNGIRNYYSSFMSIYNNSVNVLSTSATAGFAGYFYYSSATYESNEIYNNSFSNTGGGFAMYVYNPTYNNVFDYNNLYTTGGQLCRRGTPAADYPTLTTWRAGVGLDMNSISHNPGYVSSTDLRPDVNNAAAWSLNGRGIQIAGNDKDFNGNARAVTLATGVPDIGAYEFVPAIQPPNATATPAAPAAGTTQLFTFGEDTVAVIKWDATAPVPASVTVQQYTGTLPTGIASISATSMYFYTDITASAAGAYVYEGDIYYKDPWVGTTIDESGLRLAKKTGANPWVAYLPPASSADVNRNIIATTGLADFGSYTGIDIPNNASAAEITEPVGTYFCNGNFPVKVKVKNTGNNAINNVLIDWEIDGVLQTPVAYNTVIPTKGEVIVTLGNVSFNNTPKTIRAWTSLPNGQPDLVNSDDTTKRKISGGLSGNYTVGGVNPNFATFVEAVTDLKAFGVCGPVTFNIRDGVYVGQAALNGPVNGMSATNRVIFQSENHNAANVTISYDLGTASDNYVFKVSDVSFISLKDLTFSNNNTTYGKVIEIAGSSSSDSMLNCILVGPVVTASNTNTSVLFADPLTGSDNVFIGNTIRNGSYGIYYSGTSTTVLADRATFVDNSILNAYTYSTYFYYTNDLKFNHNTITTNSTSTAAYGVRCYYCDGGLEIMNNTVTGLTGGYAMYLYYNDGTAAKPGKVANNIISIGNGSTTARGIQSYYSNYQKIYNNSVNITSTSATAGYAGYFYYSSATYQNNEIRNNVFANTGGGYALFVYNPTYINSWDYNNLYTTGAKLVDQGTPAVDFATLSAWRISSGHEMNSISYNPGFVSNTDLRPDINNPASWSLNGRGIHIAGNDKDYYGNARVTAMADGVPDIGAFEFVPGTIPPIAVATPASPAAGTTQVFTFGEDTVAVISWLPNSVVPNNINIRPYTGTKAPQFPVTGFMYFYTDVDVQNVTHQFNAKFYYKDPWRGTTGAEAQLKLAQKWTTNPWNAYNDASSATDVTFNTISATNMTSLGKFTGIDNGAVFSARISPLGSIVFCPNGQVTLQANTGTGYTYQWQLNGINIQGATSATYIATAAGDYTVSVTNAANVTATSLPVAITIVSSPAAIVTATGPLTFCPGSTLTLNANTGTGLTYQWQFNNNDIPGATNVSLPIASAGAYTVTVKNIGCATTSQLAVVAPGPLTVKLGSDTSYCESPSVLVLDAGYPGATYTWSTGATTQQIALANQSGKFWVYVDAGPNCQSSDTIEVNVSPMPSLTGISYFNQGGNTFSFSPSGAQNVVSYLWIFSDGHKDTAKNTTYINNSGNAFSVKLVAYNACGTDTVVLTLPLDVVHVASGETIFRLYPNPAQSEITLSVEGNATFSNASVINSLGQLVYSSNASGVKTEVVNVSALPAGHYIIRAVAADGNVITKPFEVRK